MNPEISRGILVGIKMIYTEEIIKQCPEEKKQYFFELINSVPENLFDGDKNPFKLLQKSKKASSFLANLNIELKGVGVDLKPIEIKLKENNNKYKKALRGF